MYPVYPDLFQILTIRLKLGFQDVDFQILPYPVEFWNLFGIWRDLFSL